MTPLEIVKEEYEAILPKLDTTGLLHVYTSGSVARNEFNPNWSDVDINVVAEAPLSFVTLSGLNELCRTLTDGLHCKVGLDFVPYQEVLKCAAEPVDSRHLASCLGFIKNNHELNNEWLEAGTLYRVPDAEIVSIPKSSFVGIPIDDYITDLQVQVYETLMRRKTPDGESLHEIRILTKACLYLLQTYILSKDGMLFTDYACLPEIASAYINADASLITKIYIDLKAGNGASLHDSYEETLKSLLELFNDLVQEIK